MSNRTSRLLPVCLSPRYLLSFICYLLSSLSLPPLYLLSVICYLLSSVASPLQAATQPIELMPFTFAGRIVDYAHVAFGTDTYVEVRVKAKDGTLLAKTTTATYGNTAYNYAVSVPLASQSIAGHVKYGDAVVFEFVDPDGRIYSGIVTAGDAMIGKPGGYRKVNVILATDSNGDGVPDEYLETIEYEMWRRGITTYDPDADYDGDGQSNKAEYIAGSNPFDKTDMFSVREMAEKDGFNDYYAFKVLVSQGRTYTVSTTGKLDKDVTEWTTGSFSVADPSAALQTRLSTDPAEVGYRIIFVKKEGPQRFWQLNVE